MKKAGPLLFAALGGLVLGASAMAIAQRGGAAPDQARVERIVHDYILANPEIIPEAVKRLQARESAAVVTQNRRALETPFAGAWAGNPRADVILVEFFDYACGFCRRSNADVARLLREDKNLKVVWRELPVLGPDSQSAAEASLAAATANRFRGFHDTLFAAGRPSPATIARARAGAGVANSLPLAATRAEIDKNLRLAQAIGASGTPTFVIGDQVLQGAVGYETLRAAIAAARQRKS